jgi:Phenylalanyl-tRNA synthetase beta subunit
VDSHIISSELIETVKRIKPSIIQSVNVFDVYEGKNIEEGRKSIALGLILQEKSRTLTDDEADDIIKLTLKSLQSKYSAKLRD